MPPKKPSRVDLLRTEWFWWIGFLLLLSLHFWFPEMKPASLRDTYSADAQGKKVFFLLMNDRVADVRRSLGSLKSVVRQLRRENDTETVLCLLGPARYPTDEEWTEIVKWVEGGGRLVFAARHTDPQLKMTPFQINIKEATITNDYPVSVLMETEEVVWDSYAEIVALQGEVLVDLDGMPQAVIRKFGAGRVLVLTSDFIFSNESLSWGENSVLAFRLMEVLAPRLRTVVFDESLNFTGSPKAVGLLFDPEFRSITVQLMVGLWLFAWWSSRRFGPWLPSALTPRTNIVDHTDTVGLLMYKSRNGKLALRAYLKQLIHELKLKSHKGKEEKVLTPIAAKMGKDVKEVRELFSRASKAAREQHVGRRKAAILIRHLSRIREAAHS